MVTTRNQEILQDEYMVLDASDYSSAIPMNGRNTLAIQAVITDLDAALAGDMLLQESNDNVNWADTVTTASVTGADVLIFEYNGAAAFVRAKWTNSAGKGGCTFRIVRKR